ncbi:hypothetical protein BD311DRAFT_741334 [Dichomitus squalens]|uniref:Uncharacterized protein n=1 Tax=Dichomitus squalens TaxID=114155 RepID=A0A4Q9MH59_9APHY|nr:hypothetical protein BD311DRAFT_741334 [Dichomitus squalens]
MCTNKRTQVSSLAEPISYRIWVFIAVRFDLVLEYITPWPLTIPKQLQASSQQETSHLGYLTQLLSKWILACASGFAMAADFILTTVLIIALRQSRTGVKRPDNKVKIMRFLRIQTAECAKTSVSMLSLFFLFLILPADLGIYTAVSVVVTKFRMDMDVAGTDIVFGSEFQGDERGGGNAPVSIEFHTMIGSNGVGSSGIASPKDIRDRASAIEMLGQGTNSSPDSQLDVVDIC